MNNTLMPTSRGCGLLAVDRLNAEARAAAAAFVAAGTAVNTVRSYRSALAYWAGWLQLRYGYTLEAGPLADTVAVQFILDHLARPTDGDWTHLLPPELDAALVDAGVKGKLGALSYSTVRHRLAVLAKWHDLKNWPSPTEMASVKTLLREARKAQARQGVTVRKKTAAVREPLEAMLTTCTDGIRGLRDRALLLLAWSGGGRRRSEVVGLQVGDVRQLDADTWLYALGVTKTQTDGVRRESRCVDLRHKHSQPGWRRLPPLRGRCFGGFTAAVGSGRQACPATRLHASCNAGPSWPSLMVTGRHTVFGPGLLVKPAARVCPWAKLWP